MSKVLITGTAGFIGYHLARKLLEQGWQVVGLDSINSYYDVRIKYGRLEDSGIDVGKIIENNTVFSKKYPSYRFIKANLANKELIESLFQTEKFENVCHLAAQAGVRYSLTNPDAYIESNIQGFMNILEASRHNGVRHLVYASSSSVYGLNESMPFSTHQNVDHAISLYAASKKGNELMAHTYSYLYGIPTTGLRFFTVYGPWGRPDMALFLFTRAILEGRPIDVYNHGRMKRDFTYVDDIVECIARIVPRPAAPDQGFDAHAPDPASSVAPYRLYNIGNDNPVQLTEFIAAIEEALGRPAQKNLLPLQPGDVPATWADVGDLVRDFGYRPSTTVREGIRRFVEWYRAFFGVG